MTAGLVRAAEKLPKNAREAFIRAFKATKCMDIYSGDLSTYFDVIRAELERRDDVLSTLRVALVRFKEQTRLVDPHRGFGIEDLEEENES